MHKFKGMIDAYLHVGREDIRHVLHALIHGISSFLPGLEGVLLRFYEGGILPGSPDSLTA